MYWLRCFWLVLLLCVALPAYAALEIEIIGAGERQIPISIVPFAGEEKFTQSVSSVIAADLVRSGLFKLVDPAGKAPRPARSGTTRADRGRDAAWRNREDP